MGSDEKKTVWERLLEVLHTRGVTEHEQTYLAKLLKIRQPSVFEWKEGGPSKKNAERLAKLLGLNLDWLLTGRGPRYSAPDDPLAQELWGIWTSRPDLHEKIISYARFAVLESGPFSDSDPATGSDGPTKR